MSTEPAPPAAIDVGALFQVAKATFVRTFAGCLGRALLAVLCSYLPGLYLLARGTPLEAMALSRLPDDPAFWALNAAGMVGYQLAAAALLHRQAQLMRASPAAGAGFVADLLAAARRLPALLAGAIAWAVSVSLALTSMQLAVHAPLAALGLVPAAWMSITLLPLRAVAMLEGVGPWQAIVRCAQLARGRWLRFLATGAIAVMIVAVCVLAATLVIELVHQGLVGAGLPLPAITALLATAVLVAAATAVVYLNAVWLALHAAAARAAPQASASSSA